MVYKDKVKTNFHGFKTLHNQDFGCSPRLYFSLVTFPNAHLIQLNEYLST